MELALILIILVLAELVMSVLLLARHREYLRKVSRLERNVTKLAETMRDLSDDAPLSMGYKASAGDASISDLVEQATPEDIAKAQEVLKALGMNAE